MNERLSVIIPCFNEGKNLQRGVLSDVNEFLVRQKYNWEVLVCDDGSSDDSRKLVKEFIKDNDRFKLLELEHGGKPSAIYGGVKQAVGEISLFTDMDYVKS